MTAPTPAVRPWVRGVLLAGAWAATLLVAGCGGEAVGATWVRSGDHVIVEGASLPGLLLVTGGHVDLRAGSRVGGPVVLLGGSLAIDGDVDGDVLAPGGDLRLGPSARVAGDLGVATDLAAGGSFEAHSAATVVGATRVGLGSLPSAVDAGRWRGWGRVGLQALVVAALAAAWAFLAPRRLAAMAEATTAHVVVAASLGVLTFGLGLVAVVVMAFTLVLIPVALGALAVGGVAVASGWSALGFALMRRWVGRTATSATARWLAARPVALAAAGGVGVATAMGLVERVPVVGGAAAVAVAVTALGAVALTGFGGRRYRPPVVDEPA